ncbi:hypothetical protein PISMIDRAFT_29840 [Pisolithus microcarpus 441]|uniref:Helitron helicase-like domain-containing protein n=1 Tax=Pisolithus microcarpus 441 TaxID=765257 RepID=A0A0C9Z6M6_9AGAM|nr:hypothetical protein PISMIDRAFT_29840 [Pisolithus microcarpus 441]
MYALSAYNNAILCPDGMLDTHSLAILCLCPSCTRALQSHPPCQPRDSLANFQYYGCSQLPMDVQEAIHNASPFDIMLVSMCRASTITHHFSSESRRGGHVPEEAVQRFNRGNVAVLPQDPSTLCKVLPPMYNELKDCVCVVFSGGKYSPTQESLQRFRPVLVSKSKVRLMIDFFMRNNGWYQHEGVWFSEDNLNDLISGVGESSVFWGIEIHHLLQDGNHDGMSNMDWDTGQSDMVVENVAYTQGDHSEQSQNAMKARALAYAMDHKNLLVSKTGSSFISDADPAMMTYLFPHLDLWGIGGFNNPARSPEQQISFERQVNSPFAHDTCFPFVCWNMIQKREVSDNTSFAIPMQCHHSLINELYTLSSTLTEVATKWSDSVPCNITNEEKQVLQLFKEMSVVSSKVRGSSSYKVCCRNEICSLIRLHGTLALFVTLNPHDLSSVLMGHFGGISEDVWQSMSAYDRAVFMASHPDAAALAFHEQINAFFEIIVRYNHGPGLFGSCDAYYAMLEEQGHGTLHCHILLWLKGNFNPERLRLMMNSSTDFQRKMFAWLESIIKCELPSTGSVCHSEVDRPSLDEEGDSLDPHLDFPPQIDKLDYETFNIEFDNLIERVVTKMHIDRSVWPKTFLDAETQSIMLWWWHPRINNYNPIISFLLQCNMGVKYIGSGPAAKALVYYVSDYIMKSELKVNVGLESLCTALRSHENHFEGDQSSLSQFREKNLLTKSVNAMMGRHEISHQRVISYLIRGGDYYTADEFQTIRFHEFLNVVDLFKDSDSVDCQCGCTDSELCIASLCGATCTATAQSGNVMKQHLQFSTHEICLRNKAVVPVIVSSAIPHPDMSMHDRELFCHSMLVLFKPWRHFSDLVDSDSCWTERFDNYAFPEHISAIISNFTDPKVKMSFVWMKKIILT